MIFWIGKLLAPFHALSFLRLAEYLSARSIGAALTAILLTLWVMPKVIWWLQRKAFVDQLRETGIPSAFDKAGVELIFDALPPPDAVASVDAARLRQIVGNLLSNALRHTPSGGRVWVSTRIADGELAVDVADTGDGIAADHLSRVFERFFSTSTARDTTGGGTGVGLPISRSLARAHGGDVTAKSPGLGRGSVFSVRLPASLDQTLTINAPF